MCKIGFCLLLLSLFIPLGAQLFDEPESVVWEVHTNVWYISCAGNGDIWRMGEDMNPTIWLTGLGSVRGICIVENTMYAACNAGLAIISIPNAMTTNTITIPGSSFLNDVVYAEGAIYISDNAANKIFKYEISSGVVTTFVSTGISYPNGLWWDEPNSRLLLVSYRVDSPLQAIALPAGTVSTVMTTYYDQLDGIAMDHTGGIYISSWTTGTIYRKAQDATAFGSYLTGLSGPADFCVYDQYDYGYPCRMAIPEFNDGAVTNAVVPNIAESLVVESIRDHTFEITWVTTREINMTGYQVYRSYTNDLASAEMILPWLIPSINSDELFQEFSHIDVDVSGITRYYWIEYIETSQNSYFFGPVVASQVDNADATVPTTEIRMTIYPNPARACPTAVITLAKQEQVALTVYDAKGRLVWTYEAGILDRGETTIMPELEGLPTGLYFIKATAGNRSVFKRLVLLN